MEQSVEKDKPVIEDGSFDKDDSVDIDTKSFHKNESFDEDESVDIDESPLDEDESPLDEDESLDKENTKSLNCDFCDKSFSEKHHLNKHFCKFFVNTHSKHQLERYFQNQFSKIISKSIL